MMQLLSELRRRNVFRVAAAYLVVGWLVMQVVATIGSAAGLPSWADSLALILLITGFPIVLFIAWAFELTPEGMKKTDADAVDPGFKPLGTSDYLLIASVVAVLGVAGMQALSGPVPADEVIAEGAETNAAPEFASGLSPISDTSIAVLPFADLSPDGDQAYFGDGIAEEILNVLVRIDGLQVTSRTSAFAFRSQSELGIRDIAAELRVRHILEGSVRKAGDTLRITAQLIDAETDAHLWSETFDHPATAANVFAVQDEIASAIAAELSGRLGTGVELPTAAGRIETDDISAYDAVLQGRDYFINRSYTNLPLAIESFEHAVEVDPDYARAWAELAVAYSVAISWAMVDRDYVVLAQDAAERALELEPEISMALTALATVHTIDPRFFNATLAIDLSNRAVVNDPTSASAHLFLGDAYANVGYFDRAERSYENCLGLDPNYAQCRVRHAENAFILGHVDEGLARLDTLFSGNFADDGAPGYYRMLALSGENLALSLALSNMSRILPGNPSWLVAPMTRALSDEDYDRRAALARFETRLMAGGFDPVADTYIAMTYRMAFRAYDEMPTERVETWWWFAGYPGALESETARRGIEDLGIHAYWRENGFPEVCRPVGADDFECSWEFMQ
jgi:adenylate cyclase